MDVEYIIKDSAHKHGVENADIIHAIEHSIAYFLVDEEQQKYEYIGFDTSTRILDLITLEKHGNVITVIHAMRATQQNLKEAGLM